MGQSISILPAHTLEAEIQQGRLVVVPMALQLVRPVGIVHRRRRKLPRAAQAFLELLKSRGQPACSQTPPRTTAIELGA